MKGCVDVKVKLHALISVVNGGEKSVSQASGGKKAGDIHLFVGPQKFPVRGDEDMYLTSLEVYKPGYLTRSLLLYWAIMGLSFENKANTFSMRCNTKIACTVNSNFTI
jgi:hypothetical protein